MIDIDVQRTLFDPVERTILSEYFGDTKPDDLLDIDIYATIGDRDPSSGTRRIRLRRDQSGNISERIVDNAVARLALNSIRGHLPQWYAGYADGTCVFGRDTEPGLLREVRLKPVHLFTIDWADSGPGYSWPVAYYATYIPGFDRFVVTSSADSEDYFGYADVALGWFPGKTPIVKGSRRVLIEFWCSISEYQAKWQDFLECGLVDNVMADRWVRGVLREAEQW
jgi:hypothetical protein